MLLKSAPEVAMSSGDPAIRLLQLRVASGLQACAVGDMGQNMDMGTWVR